MTLDRSRRARAARKRRTRFLAADNDLTPAQWSAIRAAWGACAYCGLTTVDFCRTCGVYVCRKCDTPKHWPAVGIFPDFGFISDEYRQWRRFRR